MFVIDAANVVGSRPNGWWHDRGKAAADLCRELADAVVAGRLTPPVVVVLEGKARGGVVEGEQSGVRVLHAPGSGDDAIVELVANVSATVVTADRGLRDRVARSDCTVLGPRWLLDRLETGA